MGTHYLQTESGGTNGVYHGREKKISAEFAPRYAKTGILQVCPISGFLYLVLFLFPVMN
jgi:hypothetical protein